MTTTAVSKGQRFAFTLPTKNSAEYAETPITCQQSKSLKPWNAIAAAMTTTLNVCVDKEERWLRLAQT